MQCEIERDGDGEGAREEKLLWILSMGKQSRLKDYTLLIGLWLPQESWIEAVQELGEISESCCNYFGKNVRLTSCDSSGKRIIE